MPCRCPFEPGRAIRGGATGYCKLKKSDSPSTQTGHCRAVRRHILNSYFWILDSLRAPRHATVTLLC
jgi:hypothetical protein